MPVLWIWLAQDAMAASEPSSGSRSSGTAGSPILGLVTAPDTLRGCKTPPTTTMTTTPIAVAPAAQHEDEVEEGDISDHQQRNTLWREWVEEYEPGVFITVRAYPDHPLQLRHVELRYHALYYSGNRTALSISLPRMNRSMGVLDWQ